MLTKKTRYAFHALIDLLEHEEDGPRHISAIADARKIPKKFLEVILLELKKAGFLGSKMGKGGGYYFRKSPKEIKLAHIMRLIDGPIALLPCVSLNYYEQCEDCTQDETECTLRKTMITVRDEALNILENKTLEELKQKNI